jgi:Large eukaryotic DNA virus major capsid protein/Major capsid protein N-terminus
MSSTQGTFKRPGGDITTLLDLTNRDMQDNEYFPLNAATSWFARNSDRRFTPFVPVLQDFQYRGPAAFGQKFSFDIASQTCGDVLIGAVLQVQLGSWLDLTTVLKLQASQFEYENPRDAWYYANAIGQVLIEKVELEVDGDTLETVDGDFAHVFSLLWPDFNTQVGPGGDHLGIFSIQQLQSWPQWRVFPTENGYIHCVLPLFFQRTRMKEPLPLISCREGTVRINVTLRPFSQVLRQARGYRSSCDATPINIPINFINNQQPYRDIVTVQTQESEPQLQNVRLLTFGAMVDGNVRSAMLRQPFEIMHREVQTFYFEEPLKYAITKNTTTDMIRIQLPLEANNPLEEIIWFIRRKDVVNNNEWTNYSSVLNVDYDPVYNPPESMLVYAKVQANGIDLVEGNGDYFRQLIARHHLGGVVGYNNFVYGYPFARSPGDTHQPSGTLNASRLQNLRLTLDVKPPGTATWEVKVFCIGINWLRFQNGIMNKMFTD